MDQHRKKNISKQKSAAVTKTPARVNDGKWSYYLSLAIIALSAWFAMSYALKCGFVNYDDNLYVYGNLKIRNLSLQSFASFFTGNTGQYPPLVMLMFSALYSLSGPDPSVYHLANLIFHVANAVLLFYLASRLNLGQIAATVAAVLFGAHPLHVESVAWITELKDVQYTFFFLAGLLSYLRYRNDAGRLRYYYLSLALFILSCLSKGMAVVFPVALLLTDYYLDGSIPKRRWLEKIPFLAVALLWGILTLVTQESMGAVGSTGYFLPRNILLAAYGLMFYMVKMFVPVNLAAFYPLPAGSGFSLPAVYYAALAAVTGLGILVFYFRKYRILVFGFLFYAVNLLLVLQMIPVGTAVTADRYFYLSSVGLFLLIGAGCDYIYGNLKKFRLPILISGLALMLLMVRVSYRQATTWKDSITLWDNVLQDADSNPRYSLAYLNRGNAFGDAGNTDGAMNDYNRAIELDPRNADAYNNRGLIFAVNENYPEAEKDFSMALSIHPDQANALNNRGNVRRFLGDFSGAVEDFSNAIKYKPGYADAYSNRGIVYYISGDPGRACNDWQKAAELGSQAAASYIQQYCSGNK